jgi:hypothetical protein
MEINELLLKDGGMKLYIKKRPSIFGTIKLVNDIYEINYWYKSVFQNTYHEDDMEQAKTRLKDLLTNAYIQLDENRDIKKFDDYIIEHIDPDPSDVWDITNYKTSYTVSYRFDEILDDFKMWCSDRHIIPTKKMIQALFDYTLEWFVILGVNAETKEIYENSDLDFEDYYQEFLEKEFPKFIKQQKFNI